MSFMCKICGGEHRSGEPIYLPLCYQRGYARLKTELAAAEERGRRRGVEERDELRQIVRGMQPTYCEHTCPVGTLHESICVDAQASIAPRDSGKEG